MVSRAILSVSITCLFLENASVNPAIIATTNPIPAAFKASPTLAIALAITLNPVLVFPAVTPIVSTSLSVLLASSPTSLSPFSIFLVALTASVSSTFSLIFTSFIIFLLL